MKIEDVGGLPPIVAPRASGAAGRRFPPNRAARTRRSGGNTSIGSTGKLTAPPRRGPSLDEAIPPSTSDAPLPGTPAQEHEAPALTHRPAHQGCERASFEASQSRSFSPSRNSRISRRFTESATIHGVRDGHDCRDASRRSGDTNPLIGTGCRQGYLAARSPLHEGCGGAAPLVSSKMALPFQRDLDWAELLGRGEGLGVGRGFGESALEWRSCVTGGDSGTSRAAPDDRRIGRSCMNVASFRLSQATPPLETADEMRLERGSLAALANPVTGTGCRRMVPSGAQPFARGLPRGSLSRFLEDSVAVSTRS